GRARSPRRLKRWFGATARPRAAPWRRIVSGQSPTHIPQEKQSLSMTVRRVAAPQGFPYNTAPAPPASAMAAWERISVIQFLNHKDHPLMSTVEQQVKAIVAEQLGVKQEQVTNDASFVDDLGADSLDT